MIVYHRLTPPTQLVNLNHQGIKNYLPHRLFALTLALAPAFPKVDVPATHGYYCAQKLVSCTIMTVPA